MSLSLPTTSEITEQNVTNFETRLGQTIPLQDKAFVRVLAALEAGLFTTHYRYAVDRLLQNLALTATETDLDRIGTNYRVTRKAAVAFVGTILQPAADGTSIPITVDYVSDTSGIRYIVNIASPAAAGGQTEVSVTAAEPGVNGNLAASDTLTIGRQVAGITSTTATYGSTVTSGVDREDDETYRRRILQEIRTVGGGGNAADYRTWSEAVTGVYRTFPFAGAPVAATHKLADGDMELATDADWLVGNNATVGKNALAPHSGTYSLTVRRNGTNDPYAYQTALQIGRDYTIAGWAVSDGSALPRIKDGSTTLWTGTTSTSWQSFSVAFTATANDLRFQATTSTGTQYCDFDDVTLTVTDSLPGDRVVYVEVEEAIDADGIPTDAMLASVRTALTTDPTTGEDRMPLGATDEKLFVEPIVRNSFDVEITNLVVDTDSETACKASLTADVNTYFRSVVPYVTGVDSEIDKNDIITVVSLSEVVQGVLDAYGASADGITFGPTAGAPVTRYTLAENEGAKLGSITYV